MEEKIQFDMCIMIIVRITYAIFTRKLESWSHENISTCNKNRFTLDDEFLNHIKINLLSLSLRLEDPKSNKLTLVGSESLLIVILWIGNFKSLNINMHLKHICLNLGYHAIWHFIPWSL